MTDWTHTAVNHFQGFFLILVRVLAILSFVPFFGFRQIPRSARMGFALLLALLLLPLIPVPTFPADPFSYWYLVAEQVLIGVMIGFVSFIFFSAIQLAGQVIDIQIGFGLANILDPISNAQQTIIGQLQFLMAVLLFITLNGHHLILLAIHKSFHLIPLGGMRFHADLTPFMITLLSGMFDVALRLALPIMGAIFLTDVALGFLARLMPQMNILLLGFPLKILVGLTALFISFSFLMSLYPIQFKESYAQMLAIMKLLSP